MAQPKIKINALDTFPGNYKVVTTDGTGGIPGVAYLITAAYGKSLAATVISAPVPTGVNNFFIGTTASGLSSGANNLVVGVQSALTTGSDNVLLGPGAGLQLNIGNSNVAVGAQAMSVNTFSADNVAVGAWALRNNSTGYSNVAVGKDSMRQNSNGFENVSVGFQSLNINTDGIRNTSIGTKALSYNSSGNYNVAVGFSALIGNDTGTSNVAIGSSALAYSDAGNNNIGIGREALITNRVGNNNIALGEQAIGNCTVALHSVGIGFQSLRIVGGFEAANVLIAGKTYFILVVGTTDFTLIGAATNTFGTVFTATGPGTGTGTAGCRTQDNIAIGRLALGENYSGSNNIAIGYQAGADVVRNIVNTDNEIVIGNNAHTAAFIKVAFTVTSDERDKTSFANVPLGLQFINSISPIAYRMRTSREDPTPVGRVRYGFKAQDILGKEGNSPVLIDDSDPENLKYNESSMIAVLVKAVQDLSMELDALKRTVQG